MTQYSLGPAYVVINYHSANGAHKMTIPTNGWQGITSGHDQGSFTTWNDGSVDSDDMVKALIAVIKPFFPTTSNFDNYVIYTKAGADNPSFPVAGNTLGIAGTGSAAIPATQMTWYFRTAQFRPFKLVFLDVEAPANFEKIVAFPSPAYDTTLAVVAVLTDEDNAWSARGNEPPVNLVSQTFTLNEKLRREYGMT